MEKDRVSHARLHAVTSRRPRPEYGRMQEYMRVIESRSTKKNTEQVKDIELYDFNYSEPYEADDIGLYKYRCRDVQGLKRL